MTRIEKQIILDALSCYIYTQEQYINSMEEEYGNAPDISFMRAYISIAKDIIPYWKNVVDMPCGTVQI